MLHHFGSKTESYVYQSFKFQLNYEVALVVTHSSRRTFDQQRSTSRVRSSSKQFVHSTA